MSLIGHKLQRDILLHGINNKHNMSYIMWDNLRSVKVAHLKYTLRQSFGELRKISMVIGIHGNVNDMLYSRILFLCDIYLSHSWLYTKWRLRGGVCKNIHFQGILYMLYAPDKKISSFAVRDPQDQCHSIIDVIYQWTQTTRSKGAVFWTIAGSDNTSACVTWCQYYEKDVFFKKIKEVVGTPTCLVTSWINKAQKT